MDLGDTYVLGIVRGALGTMVFLDALHWARELAANGYFGDFFHVPFLAEAYVPSRLVYTGILASMLLLAALSVVGVCARLALGASAILGIYVLLCDRLQFHQNRYALFCIAGLLSLSPCDRSFVVVKRVTSPVSRIGPLWAQRLAQGQLSVIYLAAGGGKFFDADWRKGLVLADLLRHYTRRPWNGALEARAIDFITDPATAGVLAKVVIATELFLAVGLWYRRTRVFALWWGVWFHLAIQLTLHPEFFTWIVFAGYALFVTPDFRARTFCFDPLRPKGALCARLVRWFDWFARFDVVPSQPDAPPPGHSMVIVLRDGSRATGIHAFAMATRCIPALFPLWAPVALVATLTKGGKASVRGK
ncbi:MAG: HTTM domain-containing protein [Polyangiaceae bacterium]|jgi:hypothetical protein